MNEISEAARKYVAQGFSVIPIKSRDKKPALSEWKTYQMRKPSEEELEKWFGNGNMNIAIVCGAISGNLAVYDSDTKEKFEENLKKYPKNKAVRTTNGGHLYFRADVRSTKLAEKIDLKAEGGYVLVPPSVLPSGISYEWINEDVEIAELPEEFRKKGKPQNEMIATNSQASLETMQRDGKFSQLWGSTSGYASRSESEQALCCKLAFYGYDDFHSCDAMMLSAPSAEKWRESPEAYRRLTFEKALALVRERWTPPKTVNLPTIPNAPNGSGAFSNVDGEKNAPNAPKDSCKCTNAPPPYGGAFGATEGINDSRVIEIHRFGQVDRSKIKPPSWKINSLVAKEGVCFIGGAVYSFKTTFGLMFAAHLAAGKSLWDGRQCETSKVWFIDEEDSLGHLLEVLDKIIATFTTEEKERVKENLYLSSQQSLNLDFDMAILEREIAKFAPEVILLDSLRRMTGKDENASDVISLLYKKALMPLTQKFKTSWVVIHHNKKLGNNRGNTNAADFESLRGSSDIAAIASSIIMLEPVKQSNDVVFTVAKNKWGAAGKPRLLHVNHTEDSLTIEDRGEVQTEYAAAAQTANRIVEWLTLENKFDVRTGEINDKFGKNGTTQRAIDMLKERALLVGKRSPYKFVPKTENPTPRNLNAYQ